MQLLLAGALGELARQGLARVAHGGVDKVLLFAALRNADCDPMTGAGAQDLAERAGARSGVTEQHEPRGGAFEIELREERIEHFFGRELPIGPREIGAVAPVLIGAEEERLDAELPGFLADGEHVRLRDRTGVDGLFALDRGEGGNAVAQARRRLEFEGVGGRGHLVGEPLTDRPTAAGKEVARLPDQPGIVVDRDFAGAGPRTALDLVEEAGSGAVREIAVGAGAQQKGALHGVHGAKHRARAGERTEIIALDRAGAAVLDEPGCGVVGADQDVGETLVVAQHDVVPGFQLLDEIGLEQQRLGFRFGGDEHHRARVGDHSRDASRLALRRRIGGDALPDRSGLPDIEHLALGADHAIDAGPERSVAPEFLDRFRSTREARGSAGASSPRPMSRGATSAASSRSSAASARASAAGASPGG